MKAFSELQGRVAFVSGAGHGIGRATARRLAAAGALVGVNDLKAEFVQETLALIAADGGQAVGVVQDVASRSGMNAALDQLMAASGARLDIMVNNAAWVRYQDLLEITPEVLDRMLEIGFKSVIWGMQAAAERMADGQGGCIVNVASVAGLRSPRRAVIYSGIKAGVIGLTRAAAADLGPRGIRVNAVAPGAVPTEGTLKHRDPERDRQRVQRTPLGRLAQVDDVAEAILTLASERSRFITAQTLVIDGGMSQTSL